MYRGAVLISYSLVFLSALGVGSGAGFVWFCGVMVAGCVTVSMVASARAKELAAQDFAKRNVLAEQERAEEMAQADAQVSSWLEACREKHRDALVVRYRQVVRQDAYGNLELKLWARELERVVIALGMLSDHSLRPRFEKELTALVQSWIDATDAEETVFSSSNPIEYEQWCAAELRRAGWSASTTKASGDQGLDIVAEKNGRRVAIQCKLYTKPVGNKAVQEVHAAAAFVNAGAAIVVAPVDYTPSARELAGKLGVFLLHHTQLAQIEAVLAQRT